MRWAAGRSEPHLVHLDVRPLSLDTPVHRFVLTPGEQHEPRLAGDGHFERPADQGDRMAPHADLDAGELLDQPARLPSGPDEARPDLRDAVPRVGEVLDIKDLEICVLVE